MRDRPFRLALIAGVLAASGAANLATASAKAETPASAENAVAAFRSKIPLNPILLQGDPYEQYAEGKLFMPAPSSGEICAIRYEPDRIRYELRTFAGESAAGDAGYTVTHRGRCGTCSTLQDLAVYLSLPDLTTPVRSCAMRGITKGRTLRCLEGLGFSPSCAETWYYSSRNTRRACFAVCMRSWMQGEESVGPDGTLNDCMKCGEHASGAIFQLVAGRTRRTCGITSSIRRGDDENYEMKHDYY